MHTLMKIWPRQIKVLKKLYLFTGNKSQEALVLLTESANSAILDSACTSTVAGNVDEVLFRLPRLFYKEKVVENPSVECEIQADVVTSDIPLLLSKDSMKKAKMKLDLENDSANIFGKDVQLQCTSSGHYCVPIDQLKVDIKGVEWDLQSVFLADNGGEFANEIFRDMCANLNIDVMNTAAYSPWQNGICERNHAVVDDCVAKILEDQQN
ncbi:unnamed protein product [Mytilus edulis]|uniref:Integrase catalytic domain-containing protein n=1 Tax=Mytilus edulis TaxID=6550 RepID=A0A8S3U2D2_MYTED|nr:unnamed protein product [Mytilus edulis]